MNVNMQNTNQVLQKSSMVGFLPALAPKEVKKQENRTDFIAELHKEDTSNDVSKEDARQEAQAQQARSQGQRQRISQNLTTFNPQARTQDKQNTQKTGNAQQTTEGKQQAEDGQAKPRFDTSRLIQLQYSTNQAKAQGSAFSNPAEQALAQKERFLNSFKKMVDTEYNQYVKSDDAIYSRKNLREILGALGEQGAMFTKKDAKTGTTRDRSDPKGFNKLNQRLASRTLQIFEEPPKQEEEQREPLSLVA